MAGRGAGGAPWVVWLIVRDRKKQHSLFYAGLFSMLMATLLDSAGVSQGGWNYNTMLLPYFPEYLPWDLTIMPVVTMLFLQYFPKISPWLKGAAFTVIASYAVEPSSSGSACTTQQLGTPLLPADLFRDLYDLVLAVQQSCREADEMGD